MNAASHEASDIPAILTCLDLWSMRFGGKPLPQTLHTLMTYLVTYPISLLGQLNELPVKIGRAHV